MSLPTKITVRGTFVKTAGVAADDDVYETGKITIISDNWVKSPSLDFLVPPHKVEAELDSVGYFELSVISTDDPAWTPGNRTLVVKEALSGGQRTYRIAVPYDTPGGILDLADVSPVVTPTAPTQYVLLATVQAKGDLIVAQAASNVTRLPVGADTQVLVADSSTPTGLKWESPGGSSGGIPQGVINAKGDLVVGLADDTPGRQGVGTNGQYLKADSSQTTGLVWAAPTKSDVGLGSVDNTADADKPVSTAQQTALDGKANSAHTHAVADTTGLQAELDGKADVAHTHVVADTTGLQAELDGKAALVHGHAIADVTGLQTALDDKAASVHGHAIADVTGLQTALDGKQPLDTDLTTIAGLTPTTDNVIQSVAGAWASRTPAQLKSTLALVKADVGLSSVDNTSDASKPISTATQTALDGKQPIDTDLTTIAGLTPNNDDIIQRKSGLWVARSMAQLKTDLALTKSDVGLPNVDNTSDASKPISTATQTALDGKQPLDTDLTTIAGLTATTDNIIQSVAGAWSSRTPAQLKTTLALVKADVGLSNVDNTSDANKPVSTAQQTALDGKTDIPGAWTAPSSTGSGWTLDVSGTWYEVEARVEGDLVRLRGRVTRATNYTADTEIITLPVNHRPAREVVIGTLRSGGTGAAQGFLTISTAGVVTWSQSITVSTGTAWFQLDPVVFVLSL